MNAEQVVARLEALLARIRARAGEPRGNRAPAAHASAAVAELAPPATPPEHPSIVDDDEVGEWPTRPPPAPLKAEIEAAAIRGREQPREHPQELAQEQPAAPGARVEEPASDKRYESRERLVAAVSVTPDEIAADLAVAAPPLAVTEIAPSSAPEVEAVFEDAPIEGVVAEEAAPEQAGEEAPASSRRPVAPQPEERIAQIAFGADEPREPLHTPPPESGRLPAAAVADFDADVTGVRDSAPVAPLRAARSVPVRESAPSDLPTREVDSGHARVAEPVRELVPDPTHPQLPESDAVADVIGEAQRFSPGTLVALLDASLAL